MAMCDICSEYQQLLESYESRINDAKHAILCKNEIEVAFAYIQGWPQRQCMCLYRDGKNFERFNMLVQSMIYLSVHHLKHIDKFIEENKRNDDKAKDKTIEESKCTVEEIKDTVDTADTAPDDALENKDGEKNSPKDSSSSNMKEQKSPIIESPSQEESTSTSSNSPTSSSSSSQSSNGSASYADEAWVLPEVEKLFLLVSKIYLLNFPLYIAYKHSTHARLDDISAEEAQHLAIFCDLHDNEIPVYLLRNICLFCNSGGFGAMMMAFEHPDMPVTTAHAITATVSNIKLWLNYSCIVQLFLPLRSRILQYMCKLSDSNLRTASTRAMAEFVWSSVRDPLDTTVSFDVESLALAFKYFTSTTLTMRLAGIAQINSYINIFGEIESVGEVEIVAQKIAQWLTENQLIQHLFGPNLHVEVLKQAHIALNFLAVENQITEEHIKLIWQATQQLKHCSKTIFDILPSLVKNLAPKPAMHLYTLLCRMDPKEHTEQSIYIASGLTKLIWSRDKSRPQIILEDDHMVANTTASSSECGSIDGSNSDEGNCDDSSLASARKSPIDIENVCTSDTGVPPCKQARCRRHACDVNEHKANKEIGDGNISRVNTKLDVKVKNHRMLNIIGNSSSDDDLQTNTVNMQMHRKKSRKRRKNNNIPLTRLAYHIVDTICDGEEDVSSDEADDGEGEILNDSDECSDTGPVPNAVLKHLQGEGPYIRAIAETHISELLSGAENEGSYSSPMSNKSEKNMADFDDEDVSPCEDELVQMVGPRVSRNTHNCMPPAFAAAAAAMAAAHTAMSMQKTEANVAAAAAAVAAAAVATGNAQQSLLAMQQQANANVAIAKSASTLTIGKHCTDVNIGEGSHSTNLAGKDRNKTITPPAISLQPTFKINDVCQPGNTLLWDLLQDDKICQLGESLALEAEKALAALLCFCNDRQLRTKFIEGCLNNLANNKSVVVSLRLLPKLFTSFQQIRPLDTHQITMWAERHHKMMQHFFNNIKHYTKCRSEYLVTKIIESPNQAQQQSALNPDQMEISNTMLLYSHKTQVAVRLHFLSSIYSATGSPKTFRLSLDQVDALWEWLAHDSECSDCYFSWLQSQAKGGEFHALGLDALQHLYLKKLPELRPEEFSMVALGLFQQLCSLARMAIAHYEKQTDSITINSSNIVGMNHLWKIALRAHNTEVSLAAIQYINMYYMGHQLRFEREFVSQCMENLVQAANALESNEDENALMCVQRGLVLLNTHLETFRRRYAFHLRRWAIEGQGIGSHSNLKNEGSGPPIRIILQPNGLSEKSLLQMHAYDLIAELKAEISKWWENLQGPSTSGVSAPVLGLLLSEGPLRIITQGQELSSDYDERTLLDTGFKDNQIVYVSLGGRGGRRKDTNMEHPSMQPPPPKECLPTVLLLQSNYFEKLFCLMQTLGDMRLKPDSLNLYNKAQFLSRKVWDILAILPTNPTILEAFKNFSKDLEECEKSTNKEEQSIKSQHIRTKLKELLDPSNLQKFMYSLHIVESLALNNNIGENRVASFGYRGTTITSLEVAADRVLLSKTPTLISASSSYKNYKKCAISFLGSSNRPNNNNNENNGVNLKEDYKKTASTNDDDGQWKDSLSSRTDNDSTETTKNTNNNNNNNDNKNNNSSSNVIKASGSDLSNTLSNDSELESSSTIMNNSPAKPSECTNTSDSQNPHSNPNANSIHSSSFKAYSENKWCQTFIKSGGLKHLYEIFLSGELQQSTSSRQEFLNEWRHDCLASLLRILWLLGFDEVPTEDNNLALSKPKDFMLEMLAVEPCLNRFFSILNDQVFGNYLPNNFQQHYHHVRRAQVFWSRAQLIQFAMNILVSFVHASDKACQLLWSQPEKCNWVQKFILEEPEPGVRREICTGLYRICLGNPQNYQQLLLPLLQKLITFLPEAEKMTNFGHNSSYMLSDDGKEPYGLACRDYFWLLARLVDTITPEMLAASELSNGAIDIEKLCESVADSIVLRECNECRLGLQDDVLVGLINLMTNLVKHDPKFKSSPKALKFIEQILQFLFEMPSPTNRFKPKCKSTTSRGSAYDLLVELCKNCPKNYRFLHGMLMAQHTPGPKSPYAWDYWPRDEGRSECGYVGLTNLGATCYMASCIQHLYMMPQARSAILQVPPNKAQKHGPTLLELQRMFTYLLESERKAYNPRSFCRVYQMDHQPLNTGEQKDMAEFFIDLVSKLEEMTPDLKSLIKKLFCGTLSNNVVSLDCDHVSRTAEEFYTVRCQVADMRNLQESLDEVTVKDTLEGDNMYTCSQCGKKVRAEKRACFKKLPQILCFNTMRYTFNMVTMLKEKVNTHFSFPMHINMSDYVEKTLMPHQYKEDLEKRKSRSKEELKEDKSNEKSGNSIKTEESKDEIAGDDDEAIASDENDLEESLEYELVGVTVHTGTADGGHYYSFIKERNNGETLQNRWFLFNDAEVKPFDPSQIAAECFGGEMTSKTYDSVSEKYLDFSFEKTNSAYMLFYERCEPEHLKDRPPEAKHMNTNNSAITTETSEQEDEELTSKQKSCDKLDVANNDVTTVNKKDLNINHPDRPQLNKELEDWIWEDNRQFLRDRNIFEHAYFSFMWQICSHISQTLKDEEDVICMAAKLSISFFIETFIHAKEKPTMVPWVELLTKQFNNSIEACEWFLRHMSKEPWWPIQVLIQCPNQMVRQMFQRLIIHVIQKLRHTHLQYYLETEADDEGNKIIGQNSCVTRFITSLVLLLEHGARAHLRHLSEYFGLLYEFSRMGDEEITFLLRIGVIKSVADFYLGNKSQDCVDIGSDHDDNSSDEALSVEKNRPASLDKMIALIASLVERSRGTDLRLKLSPKDYHAITGGKGFPFLYQQIKDNINPHQTKHLIYALCRWDERLANQIITMLFSSVAKHTELCGPFFKLLTLITETPNSVSGLPCFTQLVLHRVWEAAEYCPQSALEWLAFQAPKNKVAHAWILQSVDAWLESYLLAHSNARVRSSAAFLLLSLIPSQTFRTNFRNHSLHKLSSLSLSAYRELSSDALVILHNIINMLLRLLRPARAYADVGLHGTTKLTTFFSLLGYCLVTKTEKIMVGPYMRSLWELFHPRLSEPSVPAHHNKHALLAFWHHTLLDCPENALIVANSSEITRNIAFNYILADHDDSEIVAYNRAMLPAYYGLLRLCCEQSRSLTRQLAAHQNLQWAFKNITPHPTQYPAAVEELFRLMALFANRYPDATEQEKHEIIAFRRTTLTAYLNALDARVSWGTLINALKVLVDNDDDRLLAIYNGGIEMCFEALHTLHSMHHEATACHVAGDLQELLSELYFLLSTLRSSSRLDSPTAKKQQQQLEQQAQQLQQQQQLLQKQQDQLKQQHSSLTSQQQKEKQLQQQMHQLQLQQMQHQLQQQHFLRQQHQRCALLKGLPEAVKRITTFLNTYNPPELCRLSLDVLREMVRNPNIDVIGLITNILINCHLSVVTTPNSIWPVGPYFPRRGVKSNWHTIPKNMSRPPRPMVQMHIPTNELLHRGTDFEYDAEVDAFYRPYHDFIDVMMRMAVNTNQLNDTLVKLACLAAMEAAPLHFNLFPKFWVGIYNNKSTNKYVELLVNNQYLVEYIHIILRDCRVSLSDQYIRSFLEIYYPKISSQLPVSRLLYTISYSMHSKEDLDDLCGDLFAIRVIAQSTGIPTSVHKQLRGSLKALLHKSTRYQSMMEKDLFVNKKIKLENKTKAVDDADSIGVSNVSICPATSELEENPPEKSMEVDSQSDGDIVRLPAVKVVEKTPRRGVERANTNEENEDDEMNNSIDHDRCIKKFCKDSIEDRANDEEEKQVQQQNTSDNSDTNSVATTDRDSDSHTLPSGVTAVILTTNAGALAAADSKASSESSDLQDKDDDNLPSTSMAIRSALASQKNNNKKTAEDRLLAEHEKRLKLLLTMDTYIKSILALMQKEEINSTSSANTQTDTNENTVRNERIDTPVPDSSDESIINATNSLNANTNSSFPSVTLTRLSPESLKGSTPPPPPTAGGSEDNEHNSYDKGNKTTDGLASGSSAQVRTMTSINDNLHANTATTTTTTTTTTMSTAIIDMPQM